MSGNEKPKIVKKVYEFRRTEDLSDENRALAKKHCGSNRIVLVAKVCDFILYIRPDFWTRHQSTKSNNLFRLKGKNYNLIEINNK